MMTTRRQIAIVRDYEGLVQAFRARRDQLELTHETIDEVANLARGHASKLFCEPPMKRLGFISLGAMLFAHGAMLVMVEDRRALEAISGHHARRFYRKHAIASMAPAPWLFDSARGREMGFRRKQKVPAKRRKAIARKAGKARWRKPRVVEITASPSVNRSGHTSSTAAPRSDLPAARQRRTDAMSAGSPQEGSRPHRASSRAAAKQR